MATRYRTPAATAVLVVLSLLPGFAGAACPLVEKIVSGTVVNESGKGLAGVTVVATWDEKGAKDVTSQTKSGADGRFEILIQYSPYSGRTFGGTDRCEAPAPTAEISAALDGRPTRERIDLGTDYGTVKLVLQ